jgi:cephalosporin-C deacetylase-like acetyl esterase
MKKSFLLLKFPVIFILICAIFPLMGQNNLRSLVNVSVVPDKPGWNYKVGEKVFFNITISRFGQPIENVEIKYELGPEKITPVKTETLVLKNGTFRVDGGTMKSPGFLRCQVYTTVDGFKYEDFATAAFEPENIKTVAELPSDFLEFWNKGKEELAKIPVNPVMVLAPEACTENANVYYVNFANITGRIYGVLSVPKKEGKYPAILSVPGAGIRPYSPDPRYAEMGIIYLQIGIHGIPVNLPQFVYNELSAGALRNYWTFNLDDRDIYYYKRVYLGCVRSVDFIFTLPQFNGVDIAVTGGSQGGALSLVTAGMDPRIKYLGALYPAICDITGYLHNRAGGWPGLFRDPFTNKPEKIKTAGYYDAVNFARFIKAPGFYSWGYNDNTCPPTSMFAAYNIITAPKELFIAQDTRHWQYPEQNNLLSRWLTAKLTGNQPK